MLSSRLLAHNHPAASLAQAMAMHGRAMHKVCLSWLRSWVLELQTITMTVEVGLVSSYQRVDLERELQYKCACIAVLTVCIAVQVPTVQRGRCSGLHPGPECLTC